MRVRARRLWCSARLWPLHATGDALTIAKRKAGRLNCRVRFT